MYSHSSCRPWCHSDLLGWHMCQFCVPSETSGKSSCFVLVVFVLVVFDVEMNITIQNTIEKKKSCKNDDMSPLKQALLQLLWSLHKDN